MRILRRIFRGLVAAAILGLIGGASASAKGITIGAGSATYANGDGKVVTFTVGSNTDSKKGLFLGYAADMEFATIDDSDTAFAYGINLKAGYTMSNITAYALFGYAAQTMSSIEAVGGGFGYGLMYQVSKKVAFAAESRDYSMDMAVGSYDYSTKTISLVYTMD